MFTRVICAISLTLVLASLTSAETTVQWAGPGYSSASGAWDTPSNWDSSAVPVSTDGIVKAYRSDGTGSNITIDTSVSGGVKLQMKYGKSKITINNGGTLTNSGLVEMFQGTSSEVLIMAGGTWNACTNASGANFLLANSTASKDTISVWGTLNVTDGSNSPQLKIGNTLNDNGYGTLNIYGGGLVNVDSYTIGSHGVINIWSGGVLKIKGDVISQADADILGNKIQGQGTTLTTYKSGGYTYVVPEPATIALLGLGGLLLRRKN